MAKFPLKGVLFSVGFLMAAEASASILPPNDLWKQDNVGKKSSNGIDETVFNQLINQVETVYKPIVQRRGGTLSFNRRWTDSTVNASAQQMFGTWYVNMYGGLARRDEITKDGFTIVICHELGHHLAGFPFTSSWAANEGESDYFAAHSCARELWGNQDSQNAAHADTVDATAKVKCDEVWSTEKQRNLCYRVADAVKSTADLLGALKGDSVDFSTPDQSRVSSTNNAHPDAQCRLDTYFAGALCTKAFDRELIPGKRFGNDRNGAQAEREAAEKSCHQALGDTEGLRSRCWFAPRSSL